MTALVDAIPLTRDADGVYRIGGTRVTLDLVVRAFNRGATAEEIVQKFPGLETFRRLPGDRLLSEAQRRVGQPLRETGAGRAGIAGGSSRVVAPGPS